MEFKLPRHLVEYLLLGPEDDRRQLQDSPILGDVWLAYAAEPGKPQELLLTPYKERPSSEVAVAVHDRVSSMVSSRDDQDADVAFLHGLVALRLTFRDLLRIVVPMTSWWARAYSENRAQPTVSEMTHRILREKILSAAGMFAPSQRPAQQELQFSAVDRFIVLSALILWSEESESADRGPPLENEELARLIAGSSDFIADRVLALLVDMKPIATPRPAGEIALKDRPPCLVYNISLNRGVSTAVVKSVPAVKADAARNLFSVNCSNVAWAVLDSGIQGDHDCFALPLSQDEIDNGQIRGASRVKASYDFSNYRKIVSLDNERIFSGMNNRELREKRLDAILSSNLVAELDREYAAQLLLALARELRAKRPIPWELVRPFVEIHTDTAPRNDHGTHVAGILGARVPQFDGDGPQGMCPDISIYDFRVVSGDMRSTEFGVIAALQFIRHLNERSEFITIHGANLSLSIPHDVRNYACGRTPVCIECERLVESGVVVVAAAGNRGYQSFTTRDGAYDGYAAFSITDPGNAESVITVGSTHRSAPHTYGVSFFSSRGPTGDGRAKPDLVAPGERIQAPFRDGLGDLDGTSMAAPHVSGAAAMLLSRYSELIGRPRRIKTILCESATDLGRERSFQGSGMLDVLRAFQKL